MARQILVIGAGISGLATAVALQRRGHNVIVIEERSDTSSGGAGISIWPNALAALDEIGLGDAVRDSGGRVTAGALRWRDGTWLRRPARERLVKALGEPLVVIRRSALTEILADALADGTLHNGLAVRELVTTADGVRVRLSDSATWRPTPSSVPTEPVQWWPATSTAPCSTGTSATRRGGGWPTTASTLTWPAR